MQTQQLPPGGNNQGTIPYQQPQAVPLVLPEAGPSGSAAPRPGDIYRNRTPMERQQMDLRTRLPINEDISVQSSPESEPVALDPPTPTSSGFNTPETEPSVRLLHHQDPELTLSSLVQEGGAPLINFLLAKAIPSVDELDKSFPTAAQTNVRAWQFQDILQLPKAQKEEWKTACHEELKSLHERRVFELTDLPNCQRTPQSTSHYSRHLRQSPIHPSTQTTVV